MYYAHIRNDGAVQTVKEHLEGTARRCSEFASAFGESERGYMLGLAHDIGKNSDEFQNRLRGGPKVDHATAGALECSKIGELMAANCVIGHHGGLPDFGNKTDPAGYPTFIGRLKKGSNGGIPKYECNILLESGVPMPQFKNGYECSFMTRMLYSCLVDADYLDTEAFMSLTERPEYDSLSALAKRLDAHISKFFPPRTRLNELRCDILKKCLEAASSPRGIYSLSVPTGGGKTIASLAYALHHAVQNNLDRVIYVIPYTSIIEQNAEIFKNLLGEENVIEHHSNVECNNDEQLSESEIRRRLACENWDAPVIVTTAVQFFESLYSNKPSKCRKLHNIANSVIVFDEAQMIPGCHLKPCIGAISELVLNFRATALLCTATQPAVEDIIHSFAPNIRVTEICPNTAQLAADFRRVTYQNGGTLSNAELSEKLANHNQVLCIVNTRKMAQQIYELLPKEGAFHLSTLMSPAHRTKILDVIRNRLKNGLTCRVVSTSLIEAGVDVDFPVVYRQVAGLDSLIQAAGRCNREGKRNPAESIVTYFEGESQTPKLQQLNVGAARQTLTTDERLEDPNTVQKYFSLWRKLVGDNIDKADIIKHLNNGISGNQLPFKTVSESFHMIDENTKTVYIPCDGQEELFRRIEEGLATRTDYRKAGAYSVNIYEQHYRALVNSGDIKPIDDSGAILKNLNLYDENKGLSLESESGQAYFV